MPCRIASSGKRMPARPEARTLPEIAEEVARGRDTQFDPRLVDALLELHERGELGL